MLLGGDNKDKSDRGQLWQLSVCHFTWMCQIEESQALNVWKERKKDQAASPLNVVMEMLADQCNRSANSRKQMNHWSFQSPDENGTSGNEQIQAGEKNIT